MALSAAQLASMRATVSGVLGDTATSARTSASVSCWLYDSGRTVDLAGDMRISPLSQYALIVPYGTDVRAGDSLTVVGKGTFFVINTDAPGTTRASVLCDAIQLTDPSGHPIVSTSALNVIRGGTTVSTGVVVHVEPVNPTPFEQMHEPEQGATIYDHYVLYTLSPTIPVIHARDHLVDPADVDPLTGQARVYYARRIKKWASAHLEIEADCIAASPST